MYSYLSPINEFCDSRCPMAYSSFQAFSIALMELAEKSLDIKKFNKLD